MIVVGLDLSWSATGVALLGDCPRVTYAIRTAPGRFASMHHRLEHITSQIREMTWKTKPDLVVVEQLLTHHANALAQQAGLWYMVTHDLWSTATPFATIPPPVLKKFATGKGSAAKADMAVATAVRFGLTGLSEDEHDALWLAAAGASHLGICPIKLPAAHVAALYALKAGRPVIDWPLAKQGGTQA